ncbi:MAG: M3 family oligoendopeptidase [Flavobacterium sp.]|nr:M3 family oligoendopeptidase [Flavobacterium sp.]
MKNFIYTILLFSLGVYAIYEQSKPEPNKFIMFGAFALFMVGLYKIMKKIPSKNEQDDEE